MKKHRRTFDYRRIKANYSYDVAEICETLDITKGTSYSWINKEGLKPIDNISPYLLHGTELKRFLQQRQKKRKHKCQPNEMFCLKCQRPRRPKGKTSLITSKGNNPIIKGFCIICNTQINKAISQSDLQKYKEIFNLQSVDNEHLVECETTATIYNKNKG